MNFQNPLEKSAYSSKSLIKTTNYKLYTSVGTSMCVVVVVGVVVVVVGVVVGC